MHPVRDPGNLMRGQVAGIAEQDGVAVVAVAALADTAERILIGRPCAHISALNQQHMHVIIM